MKFPTLWLVAIVIVSLEPNTATCKNLPPSDTIDLSHYGPRLFGTPSSEVGRKVANWKPGQNQGNPEELGSYLEGDILVPRSNLRNALINESYYWPDGVIPYVIGGGYTAAHLKTIQGAFDAFHNHTCIKFVKRTDSDKDYISIESRYLGCWSSVGRIGGKQVVNLQKANCLTQQGTTIHELMHVCGFHHEHKREDRDEYIEIKWENINARNKHNFVKVEAGTATTFGTAYDYSSLMHYSKNAFAKRPRLTTIIPKDKNFKGELGQRIGFSKSDIERINKMYKCEATTASTGETQISDAPCSSST